MNSYLVTGGCGFIGSHLCRHLIELGKTVYVIDNLSTGKVSNLPGGVHFVEGDIRDLDLLTKLLAKVDGCFHLAAIASVQICEKNWLEAHEVNLTGTLNVFEAAKRALKNNRIPRVVYASSAATYGNIDTLPLNEAMSSPISMYGTNKLCDEYYAHMASVTYNVPTIGLRLFNVYGPNQNPDSAYSGVITIFLNRLIAGESLTIYGDGNQSRDFIYVNDAVSFFIAAMNNPIKQSKVLNACSGVAVTIKELGDTLGLLLDIAPVYTYQPAKPGDIYRSLGDPGLAFQTLQVKTITNLNAGLAKLIAHYKLFTS